MSADLLHRIQTLQFSDKRQAETLLLSFLRDIFSRQVQTAELRPLAVSLNSFNGFLTMLDGRRFFFKTHTEPDGVIGEYYNAAQLANAGYPIIQPIFSSTEAGKQLLIYEVIDSPSVFDVSWKIENGETGLLLGLAQAQQTADKHLFELYKYTLSRQSADDAAKSPIHQLFYHRLVGGRLERFYGALPGKNSDEIRIALPGGQHSMQEVRRIRWVINGQQYSESLDDLITEAINLLNPAQAGPSVIGHGDAHNGNVFFRGDNSPSLLYFDPAFAGRHHPLLDLAKPLFHNVFAMWMYFPRVKREHTALNLNIEDEQWHVEHNYSLPTVREVFLQSKVDLVLVPILRELQSRGWLRDDWRDYLKAALFCCPFLTMNLADSEKFPPEISLLGLTMAVEMGANSVGIRSIIDRVLDGAEARIII